MGASSLNELAPLNLMILVKKVPKTDKDLICWDLCFVLGKIFYF